MGSETQLRGVNITSSSSNVYSLSLTRRNTIIAVTQVALLHAPLSSTFEIGSEVSRSIEIELIY